MTTSKTPPTWVEGQIRARTRPGNPGSEDVELRKKIKRRRQQLEKLRTEIAEMEGRLEGRVTNDKPVRSRDVEVPGVSR